MKKYKLKALFRNKYDKLIPQDSVLGIMDEIVDKDYFENLSKKIIKEETDFEIEDYLLFRFSRSRRIGDLRNPILFL